MRLCPKCRREYLDDTLAFCLDDGSLLLDGPGSESATAILGENDLNPDFQVHRSETPPRKPGTSSVSSWQRTALLGLAAVLVGAAAFALYRYLAPSADGRIESIAVLPFVNETGNPDLFARALALRLRFRRFLARGALDRPRPAWPVAGAVPPAAGRDRLESR